MELIRPKPAYTVRDAPVYGTLEFTCGSTERLTSPQAFEFAKKNGGRLQSLGHAVVARVALYNDDKESHQGLDGSNEYQKTSTVSLRFRDGKKIVTAFAELDDDHEGLALVQESYDANHNGRELIKPLDNSLVSRLVQTARESGRICPPLTARPFELSTVQKKGKSDYGRNEVITAAFGSPELAELNAGYLQERGYKNGFLWDFIVKELEEKLQGKEGHALIWPVGLGGDNCNDVADYDFSGSGRARGLVHVEQKIFSLSENAQDEQINCEN